MHFDTDVLVVGAGPVGLTSALELRRRGIDVAIVDRLAEPPQYAKAVGIQPRTLEVWDAMGVLRPALDASTPMRGQVVYVDGTLSTRLDLALPDDVPFRFVAMPQYATERILAEALTERGTPIRRGVELVGFTQNSDDVTATLRHCGLDFTVTARYLVGCDGAHSIVRKGLGVSFEGDAFPEEYMLADVEVDWSMPDGYGVRAMRTEDGQTTDIMVCIPLPGTGRYRISSLVSPDLATAPKDSGEVAHGFEAGRRPTLDHIQAVLDRLSPEPTQARNLRWSSVFRISHRLAGSYSAERVFLAGDAAHIHPPTGAQGMNTGIQDAYNLGWKIALAVQGRAADGLLDSYDAERRPVGEEVVGRTVHHARAGIGAGETDPQRTMLREAQLLVGYRDSRLVDGGPGEPAPGDRAPDAPGLQQDTVASPIRVHDLLRHPGHTLLLWAPTTSDIRPHSMIAESITDRYGPVVRPYVITPDASATAAGTVLRDAETRFAKAYGLGAAPAAVTIRPDGYLGHRSESPSVDGLVRHLDRTLLPHG
ncbi:2-polyprenyl-6-methoxyphenol hydroxylase-like FAD-dependent oxidoreductase [Rhodococcus sp. OK519]|uniref:FAD-dependent oxidoreductase n=1 Tax=Rhodococcus sp. OK519 TaxID=2135729 RepID=UPI000D3A91E5|nr:2-polyprenyl-6-methoxyphenol hydroxylase-like FAD-dependent oxidoreductase [Rhodococcus sp. OK519]